VHRVLHQPVLEAIDRIRGCAALEHQLGGDKAGESPVQLILQKLGNGTQQSIVKLASDRRADLRRRPRRRQVVKPRQQRGVQTRRDCEWRQRGVQHVAIRFLAQQAALQHLVNSSMNSGTPSARSAIWATT
jgi:hypothetical protein